jgi:hypothetical protein
MLSASCSFPLSYHLLFLLPTSLQKFDGYPEISRRLGCVVRHLRQIEVASMQMVASLFVFENPTRGGSLF